MPDPALSFVGTETLPALSQERAIFHCIGGGALLVVTGLGMTAALYLDVTSQAAITGRRIQSLRTQIVESQLVNADLQSSLAELTSTESMEQRAIQLGYEPVAQADLQYVPVPGFIDLAPVNLATIGALRPALSPRANRQAFFAKRQSAAELDGNAADHPFAKAQAIHAAAKKRVFASLGSIPEENP